MGDQCEGVYIGKAASRRSGWEGAPVASFSVRGDAEASSREKAFSGSNGWKAMSRKKSRVKKAAPMAAFNV